MSFDNLERGHGRPIELYQFTRRNIHWRFTSSDRDVTIDGATYTSTPIKRSAIEAGSELSRSGLTVECPRDNPVADMYRLSSPSDVVTLILRQVHAGTGDVAAIWSGRIVSVKWRGAIATIDLEPVFTSVKRMGLRRRYQRSCPHVLYGPECGLMRDAWRQTAVVSSVSGITVQLTGLTNTSAGYYTGGYIEWTTGGGVVERRYITSHVGQTLTLAATPVGLAVGQSVNAYPGCDHTLATCNSKFSNAINYGGMPYIPDRSPFGSFNPIY